MESGTTLWTSVVRRLGSLQHQMVVNCLCPSPPSSGMQTFLLCRLAAREAHSPKLQASHASSPSYWSCIPCALTRRQDLMPDLSSIRRLRREPPPNQRMKLSALRPPPRAERRVEAIYPVCGGRTPQLMRDPLGAGRGQAVIIGRRRRSMTKYLPGLLLPAFVATSLTAQQVHAVHRWAPLVARQDVRLELDTSSVR